MPGAFAPFLEDPSMGLSRSFADWGWTPLLCLEGSRRHGGSDVHTGSLAPDDPP